MVPSRVKLLAVGVRLCILFITMRLRFMRRVGICKSRYRWCLRYLLPLYIISLRCVRPLRVLGVLILMVLLCCLRIRVRRVNLVVILNVARLLLMV